METMHNEELPGMRECLRAALSGAVADGRRLFDALNALALLDENQEETTLTELALGWLRSGGGMAAAESGAQSAENGAQNARSRGFAGTPLSKVAGKRSETGPGRPIGVGEFFALFEEHYCARQTCSRAIARSTGHMAEKAWGADRPVETLGRDDLLEAVAGYSNPATWNGRLSRLVAALRWGNREKLCSLDFLDLVEYKPEPWKEPSFFSPERVERIMRAAESDPGPVESGAGMALSLGFFAGARSSEIWRARWEDLDLDGAVLRIPRPKGWTRGAKPRLVELEGNAVRWMRKWKRWTQMRRRGGKEPEGPVVPKPWLFSAWKARVLAPLGLSWGNDAAHNAMRHTYATMHVAAFRNAAATALNLGHGRGTEILEKHYRGLATKATGLQYWKIEPQDEGANEEEEEEDGE